ncbi:MAG: toprim domain-containing protein [Eubacteriales bacterium]
MPYLSQETIAKAREVDLFSYLKATNPNELVKCDGNEYCTRTHDSLKISNGKWFWWSRGIGGTSALDYLVKVCGVDFVSAVEAVLGKAVEIPSFVLPEKKKSYERLYVPRHSFSCTHAKNYLLDRGIDEAIVDECIGQKMIAENSKNGAVLFLGYDEKGVLKHCCSRATDGSSGKKDMAGSDKRYAFGLATNDENLTVRVFESAIDLLSYATMLKELGKDYRTENLISLSGIYLPKDQIEETKIPMPLEHYLATHPNTKKISLYLDNDFAGRRGADALQVILGGKYEVRFIPPPAGKDYNDYLMTKKQIQVKCERKETRENSDQNR